MQTSCTSFQTDNHTNTSTLNFYRPAALPDAPPTAPKHRRQRFQQSEVRTVTAVVTVAPPRHLQSTVVNGASVRKSRIVGRLWIGRYTGSVAAVGHSTPVLGTRTSDAPALAGRLSDTHASPAVLRTVLFFSRVLDPTVGHTMDVLSPFISLLCHSD